MNRKESNVRKGFRSRASIARPKNQNLSYKERLAIASKGKDACEIDLGAPVDAAGYITIR